MSTTFTCWTSKSEHVFSARTADSRFGSGDSWQSPAGRLNCPSRARHIEMGPIKRIEHFEIGTPGRGFPKRRTAAPRRFPSYSRPVLIPSAGQGCSNTCTNSEQRCTWHPSLIWIAKCRGREPKIGVLMKPSGRLGPTRFARILRRTFPGWRIAGDHTVNGKPRLHVVVPDNCQWGNNPKSSRAPELLARKGLPQVVKDSRCGM